MTLALCGLFSLGPLFWGGELFSQMADQRTKGEAEQSLHCGWVWLQPGCSGEKTAQRKGRALLQLGVTAACFALCDIPNLTFLIRWPIALFHTINITLVHTVTGLICKPVGIHHSLYCVSLQDEILRGTEKLQKELEPLMKEYEKAAQQRIVLQQELNDAAEVDINATATNKLFVGRI